jgi:hypothetical protein
MPAKRTTGSDIRTLIESGKSVLLLFGLGPRGLPKEMFEVGQRHLDITGRGLSLETCTALGAVIGSLLGK